MEERARELAEEIERATAPPLSQQHASLADDDGDGAGDGGWVAGLLEGVKSKLQLGLEIEKDQDSPLY
jgi:hypothetical protein